ncbi:cysteine-rich and transmembrane domain-containing protein B isoform X4 [Solanum lycopersicum]|uniref:cysteine-rich and transmembrane domain-containing protein B isoform X4 n=1 Tax=Solanum lycopersicum TaxID=4081 RepID=UPI000532E87A|nr:cysteine-rich and transmembrane domain-containing protein WIH1 isoform X4 [Solanum lycopersicum]
MSYQHVHEGPYPPPGYAPPPPGPEGYPPPGQPEPFGYYGEAPPPPPPPGPPSYQGYFNDQYPPPDHIHHDQQPDHHSSGCCSFLKGWHINNNSDHATCKMIISGFTGQLRGWWDNFLSPEER